MNNFADRIRAYVDDYRLVLGGARRDIPRILVVMLGVAGLDVLGVGLIAPLAKLMVSGNAPDFMPELGGRPGIAFLLIGSALVVIFAFKGWFAYRLYRRIVLFSESHRAALIDRLVGSYQALDWQSFARRNSSDIIAQVHAYTGAYSGGTLTASLLLVTNGIVFLVLATLLAAHDFSAVLVIFACIGIYVVLIHRPLQRAQTDAQRKSLEYVARNFGAISQALGAMREVRVLGHEAYFRAEVRITARQIAEAMARQTSLSQVPRFAIEVVMILVIVIVAALRFAAEGTAGPLVPTLAVFAAAGVRLIPAATTIASALSGMRSTRFVLHILAQELTMLKTIDADSPEIAAAASPGVGAMQGTFRELRLENITFTYRDATQPALQNVGLRICAGETIGLMGKSGAGKSTLADVILGLLVPQAGRVLVNGRGIHEWLADWRRLAAYIPQAPYLLDDSVRRNIVFGTLEDRIDEARVNDVIDRVQLRAVLDRLPQGLDTRVGERGATLSGGQRQRLALARALYQRRQFLILDEATSALDEETERGVLDAVRSLHGTMTILIIAHSERTLAMCDRIERL